MHYKLKEFNIDIEVSRMANIHYFEFSKEYHSYMDSHSFRELIYVDSGKINVDSDGYRGTLKEKQLLIHKDGEMHSLSCRDGGVPSVIIIGFECLSDSLDYFSSNPHTLSVDLVRMLSEVVREGRNVFLPPYDIPGIRDMKKRADYPFGADQMLKLRLEAFLIELVRNAQSGQSEKKDFQSDSKLDEMFSYINNNFCEKITLDGLCFLFGTNKTTICKSFKEAHGCTVISYINKLRIEEAKKLIREKKMSLTEISSKLGFSSIHYFSKLFKSLENMSPTDYIEKELHS